VNHRVTVIWEGIVRNKILIAGAFLLIFSAGLSAGLPTWLKPAPKIVTPDRNNSNDRFYIFYNANADQRVSGCIFNLIGMKMASFRNIGGLGLPGSPVKDPNYDTAGSTKTWEGCLTWDAGSAPSGIYIWQVESGNEIYTGTVVVAR